MLEAIWSAYVASVEVICSACVACFATGSIAGGERCRGGEVGLARGLPTTDFLAGVRIGDLARTVPAELAELLYQYDSYFWVGTHFLPEQMRGIVFQALRLARLRRQIQLEQAYVFELRMWMTPVDCGPNEVGTKDEVLQTTF